MFMVMEINMKKYKVKIKGVTPYMQKRMDDAELEEWEKKRGKIIERKDISDSDYKRALFHSHIDDDGNHYVPSEQLEGSMINAGAFMKAKVGNSRKSMKNIVAAMFSVYPINIPILEDWAIDKRSGVNRNIRGRVILIRPKWKEWKLDFEIHVDNDTITDETVKEILIYAG